MSDQPSVQEFTDYIKQKEYDRGHTQSGLTSFNTTQTPIWVGGAISYDNMPWEQMGYIRLECLRMAIQHATPDQAKDGTVYKIADDYYNYIVNRKHK